LEKLRPDSVLPRNEQSNQEQNDAAANQNETISEVVNEAEVDISVGKNDASFPRTTREVFQQHKLVFHDVNAVSRLMLSRPKTFCKLFDFVKP